jgi:hypothetical protein
MMNSYCQRERIFSVNSRIKEQVYGLDENP